MFSGIKGTLPRHFSVKIENSVSSLVLQLEMAQA